MSESERQRFQCGFAGKNDGSPYLTGQDVLAEFESSPRVYRVFCRTCASPIFSKCDAMPDLLRLRLGTLDTPVKGKPSMHIFVASKAPWFDIHDDAPQFPEGPNG